MSADDQVTQFRPLSIALTSFVADVLREAGRPKKVIHYYAVGTDQNLYCAGCGKNIIATAYGDLALPIDSRPPNHNEIVCGEF